MTLFCGFRLSIERGIPAQHNIHRRLVRDLVSRSAVPPATAETLLWGHISSTPKRWQAFTDGISDAQAAVAVALHPSRLFLGEQGIRHESVIPEHGVVVPWRHGSMLLGVAR